MRMTSESMATVEEDSTFINGGEMVLDDGEDTPGGGGTADDGGAGVDEQCFYAEMAAHT